MSSPHGIPGIGEVGKREATQREVEIEQRFREEADFLTAKCRCKNCGKEFNVRIHAQWKSDAEEKQKVTLDANAQNAKL